jgi:hypothetical protein
VEAAPQPDHDLAAWPFRYRLPTLCRTPAMRPGLPPTSASNLGTISTPLVGGTGWAGWNDTARFILSRRMDRRSADIQLVNGADFYVDLAVVDGNKVIPESLQMPEPSSLGLILPGAASIFAGRSFLTRP